MLVTVVGINTYSKQTLSVKFQVQFYVAIPKHAALLIPSVKH